MTNYSGLISWASIVKMCFVAAPQMPCYMKEHMTTSKQLLHKTNIRIISQSKPVSAYFRNLRRGSFGEITTLLRESIRSGALLAVSLVAGLILEIITNEHWKDRLKATRKKIGIRSVENYDICSKQGDTTKGASREGHKKLASKLLKRIQVFVLTSTSTTLHSGTKLQRRLLKILWEIRILCRDRPRDA